MMMMTMRLESRRGSVRAGSWVWVGGWVCAVRAMRWTGISTLDARRSTFDARISNPRISAPDGRGFDSIRSIRSFDSR